MKAIADAAGNFARIIPVRSAESVGTVEQVARIADILCREIHAEIFAKGFSERERKFRVIGKMLAARRRSENRSHSRASGSVGAPGQRGMKACAERVALVVIEIAEPTSIAELAGIGNQAAVTTPEPFNHLIRVSQEDVKTIGDAWRTHCRFPAVNAGALDGSGRKILELPSAS